MAAQPVPVPFPVSTNPGSAPNEGGGRLVNCYAYKENGAPRWRALPGLKSYISLASGSFRGAALVGTIVYVVIDASLIQVFPDGSTNKLDGAVPGSGPVTIERNLALTPDVVVNTNKGAVIAAGSTVQSYPDGNLPFTNSVAFLDGYFLFTTLGGQIWASNLNTTAVNGLSEAIAQARQGAMLRGVAYGQLYYAMAVDRIEVYQDAGLQPFPLTRVSVIPNGLIGQWAVAGYQAGWAGPLIFVAADGSVRRLDGTTPTRVSNEDLERLIQAVPDKSTLVATVYTFGGNAIWSLSCPDWTWEFNVTTEAWHQRQSVGLPRWRAMQSFKVNATDWLFGDVNGSGLLVLDTQSPTEVDDPLIWGMDSGQLRNFPVRMAVPSMFFDFVLGETDDAISEPKVMFSWSKDGGATYSTPIYRSLGKQGVRRGPIRLDRLGLTTHHGIVMRFRISDPVYTTFAGAVAGVDPRRT